MNIVRNKMIYKYLILIFIINSCNSSKNQYCGSNYGYSKTSEESKKNGVFKSYYYTPNMKISVPKEGIDIRIKEIYRESRFQIDENNKIIPLESSQLIIKIYDSVPEEYSLDWKIGDYKSMYFTGGKDYFDADLRKINKFDTLTFVITRGRYSNNENEVIGNLVLIEKGK